MSDTTRIAVIGLEEAGGLIAGGLAAAGADVIGFDPAKPSDPPVAVAESAEAAVAGADVVISINSSTVSRRVTEQLAPALDPGAIFADLNTGTPALKKSPAELFPTARSRMSRS